MKENEDVNGQPIGQPYRSGTVMIQNGQMLCVNDYLIEIVIPAQATPASTYSFTSGVTGFLLNAYYWNIQFFTADTLPKSPITQGQAVVTQAMMNSMFINMQTGTGFQMWSLKPARTLQTINDVANKAGNINVAGMVGSVLNWQNSNIVFGDPTVITANTPFSILLSASFTLNANWQKDGLGSRDISRVAN